MSLTPFRPVDVLRRLEAHYGSMAEQVGATFEAFGSLGCENGRLGDADVVEQLVRGFLDAAPVTGPDSSVRLKFSARPEKPVVIEVVSSAGLTPDPAAVALVTGMGGTVTPTGGGTGVKISLPLEEAPLDTVEAEASPQEESNRLDGMRILIADDSATNRLVLEEMLADTGAALVSVQDGKEALDRWQAAKFDLLLLDISMPVMDGVTAIREIRAIEQKKGMTETPAVAVTANALVNQVADYLVAGFDTHLAKPFRRTDLMHAILTLRR